MKHRAAVVLCRLVALLLICVLCASWGWRAGVRSTVCRSSFHDLNAAQLSWVIEGIQEQISALYDDLGRAQVEQRAKLEKEFNMASGPGE